MNSCAVLVKSQRSDLGTPISFKQDVSEEGEKKPPRSAPPPPPPPLPGPLLRTCFCQHRSLDCGKASNATQLSSVTSWEWPNCAIRRISFFPLFKILHYIFSKCP